MSDVQRAEYLLAIDSALGRDGTPRPEVWASLTAETRESAATLLDAAASRAREYRRLIKMAEAAKAEAAAEVHLASARVAEYEKALKEIEDNLVRPLCQGFGEGKTHQIDTGFARVALVRKPPSAVLSEAARALDPADVVAMLPPDLVRIKPPEPNKAAIKEAIESGVIVRGWELAQGETRIDWRS